MFEGCADDFHYTNQGQSPTIDGQDDANEMCNTRRAFSLLSECWINCNWTYTYMLNDRTANSHFMVLYHFN